MPTCWPSLHGELPPWPTGSLATEPRQTVVAWGLPRLPGGSSRSTCSSGLVMGSVTEKPTVRLGEFTASLTALFGPTAGRNAPAAPLRKFPIAEKTAFGMAGWLWLRTTEKLPGVRVASACADAGTPAQATSAPTRHASRRRRLPALIVNGPPMVAVGVR